MINDDIQKWRDKRRVNEALLLIIAQNWTCGRKIVDKKEEKMKNMF